LKWILGVGFSLVLSTMDRISKIETTAAGEERLQKVFFLKLGGTLLVAFHFPFYSLFHFIAFFSPLHDN